MPSCRMPLTVEETSLSNSSNIAVSFFLNSAFLSRFIRSLGNGVDKEKKFQDGNQYCNRFLPRLSSWRTSKGGHPRRGRMGPNGLPVLQEPNRRQPSHQYQPHRNSGISVHRLPGGAGAGPAAHSQGRALAAPLTAYLTPAKYPWEKIPGREGRIGGHPPLIPGLRASPRAWEPWPTKCLLQTGKRKIKLRELAPETCISIFPIRGGTVDGDGQCLLKLFCGHPPLTAFPLSMVPPEKSVLPSVGIESTP